MYTTKDIKSITVQSVHLIIIRLNDNKSYTIDDNELVDIINKETKGSKEWALLRERRFFNPAS